MAGGQERILRGRIRSIQSTKKITRAMELIATSRIMKARARVDAARPYAEQIGARFRLALKRFHLNERNLELRTDLFRRPVRPGGQMSLL